MDTAPRLNEYKYTLYEASVQYPKEDAEAYRDYYKIVTGKNAHTLREDFCGTFAFSVEWVKLHPQNKAVCLDIDPKPISYGFKHHYPKLDIKQQRRIKVLQQNVISKTTPTVDLTVANNFSFNIFHKEETLLQYFKSVHSSLNKNGAFILEMVGGPGFTEKGVETRNIRAKGIPPFTYYWDQQSYNPITTCGKWAIHFKYKNKKKIKNAFIYDWRLWSIPEVRYTLKKAGFKDTIVLWDCEASKNQPYKKTNNGENFECWIAYIAGIK